MQGIFLILDRHFISTELKVSDSPTPAIDNFLTELAKRVCLVAFSATVDTKPANALALLRGAEPSAVKFASRAPQRLLGTGEVWTRRLQIFVRSPCLQAKRPRNLGIRPPQGCSVCVIDVSPLFCDGGEADLRKEHAMIGRRRLCLCSVLVLTTAALSAQAEAEPEKFALLVGETNYLQPPKDYTISILRGPGNDVALIRQLLVKRYGFKDDPAHIEVLTGSEASREGITKAFQTQLIDKAKAHPDARVVFYFSGHGSTTTAPDNAEPDGKYDTLVAYDSRAAGGRDIAEDEIRGWLDTLRGYTQDITVILDSCRLR